MIELPFLLVFWADNILGTTSKYKKKI